MSRIKTFLSERFSNEYASHLAELLSTFHESGLASPHFIEELASGDEGKLWARAWEALLYRHLQSLGFQPRNAGMKKSGERGPDLGIVYQRQKIWIEAVTPAPEGISRTYLAPPQTGVVEPISVPYTERLLRWTSVLKSKRNKLESYMKDNIIADTDCTIVAINSCRLQYYAPDDLGNSKWPFAVEAVFPIGPIAFPIARDGKPDGQPANIPRHSIKNINNSSVQIANFLDRDYSNVSALLGCQNKDMLDGYISLTLVHNPLADVPLPRGILGAQKEFVAEPLGDHYRLRLLTEPH